MLTMLANVRAEEDDYYKHNSQSFEGIWMKFDFLLSVRHKDGMIFLFLNDQ